MKVLAKKSFSIVEIIVSLSIFLIIVSISIPIIFNFDEYHLNNEMDQLFVIASYLQQKAIACYETQKLTFDLNENSYAFEISGKQRKYFLSKSSQYGFLPSTLGPPGKPRTTITQAILFDNRIKFPMMQFFSDGTTTQGTVYMVNKKKNLMVALTCSVSPNACLRKYVCKNDQWEQI